MNGNPCNPSRLHLLASSILNPSKMLIIQNQNHVRFVVNYHVGNVVRCDKWVCLYEHTQIKSACRVGKCFIIRTFAYDSFFGLAKSDLMFIKKQKKKKKEQNGRPQPPPISNVKHGRRLLRGRGIGGGRFVRGCCHS